MSPTRNASSPQASLTDFECAENNDAPPSRESDSNPDNQKNSSASETPPDRHEKAPLPELCEWEQEFRTIDGVTVAVPAAENSIDRPGGGIIRPRNIAYVVDRDALEAYRERHGQTTVTPPKYYSKLDDFEPVLTAQTATSRKGGYGITRGRLRDTLRLLAGTGRFSQNALTITACGRHRYIAEYQTDDIDVAYLIRPEPLSPHATDHVIGNSETPTEHTIGSLTLPDDHPEIGDAFQTFQSLLETHFDISLVTHLRQKKRYHYFESADETTYKVSGADILNATYGDRPIVDALGDYTIDTDYGESFSVNWDTAHYELGDSPWQNRDQPAVFGATFRYHDPRTSSRASLSKRVKAYATYIYIEPSTHTDSDVVSLNVSLKDEAIGRFKPDNETTNSVTP
jgi:hypothetical protein